MSIYELWCRFTGSFLTNLSNFDVPVNLHTMARKSTKACVDLRWKKKNFLKSKLSFFIWKSRKFYDFWLKKSQFSQKNSNFSRFSSNSPPHPTANVLRLLLPDENSRIAPSSPRTMTSTSTTIVNSNFHWKLQFLNPKNFSNFPPKNQSIFLNLNLIPIIFSFLFQFF